MYRFLLDDVYLVKQCLRVSGYLWTLARGGPTSDAIKNLLLCTVPLLPNVCHSCEPTVRLGFVYYSCLCIYSLSWKKKMVSPFRNQSLVEIGWQVVRVSSLAATPSELGADRLTWEGYPAAGPLLRDRRRGLSKLSGTPALQPSKCWCLSRYLACQLPR